MRQLPLLSHCPGQRSYIKLLVANDEYSLRSCSPTLKSLLCGKCAIIMGRFYATKMFGVKSSHYVSLASYTFQSTGEHFVVSRSLVICCIISWRNDLPPFCVQQRTSPAPSGYIAACVVQKYAAQEEPEMKTKRRRDMRAVYSRTIWRSAIVQCSGTCNVRVHRYCAGVTTSHYKKIAKRPELSGKLYLSTLLPANQCCRNKLSEGWNPISEANRCTGRSRSQPCPRRNPAGCCCYAASSYSLLCYGRTS